MKTIFPSKLKAANLPTKIEKLKMSDDFDHIDVYVKRDDQTGFELSGNKVRKLEYIMHDVLENGCNHVITCGGLQSNHARATAAYAAKLGLKCTLVLKGTPEEIKCNYYMDQAFGAEFHYITGEEYKFNRHEIMQSICDASEDQCYIIPEGASNGLGNLGYFDAYKEIDVNDYDMIALAVGSCGTYAGLFLASAFFKDDISLLGINIYDAKVDYNQKTYDLMMKSQCYFTDQLDINLDKVNIINDYVGKGYGITSPEVLDFMMHFSKREGLLLDKVYTGKAMHGLYQELKKLDETLHKTYKVLFIHTGGTFVY